MELPVKPLLNVQRTYKKMFFINANMFTDPDAARFLSAVAPYDTVGRPQAIINLVKGLKSVNAWFPSQAFWPYYGGTATAHTLNLFNPLTFALTHVNSPTHNANGCQYNNTNQYSYSTFSPAVDQALNRTTFGLYNGTNLYNSSNRFLITANYYHLFYTVTTINSRSYNSNLGAALSIGTDVRGNIMHVRRLYNNNQIYHKLAGSAVNTVASGGVMPIGNLYLNSNLGASNFAGARFQCAYAFADLATQQALDFLAVVQAYQTDLGRQF